MATKELMGHLKKNNHVLDVRVLSDIYKRTKQWPNVEWVMKHALVRNLKHAFMYVKRSAPLEGLDQLAHDTGVFLIKHNMSSSIVEVWGPNEAALAVCIGRLISLVNRTQR